MERVIIEPVNEGYSFNQIDNTMTVGELIELLQEFDENAKIYFSFDNRYTVGSLRSSMIEVEEAEENEK